MPGVNIMQLAQMLAQGADANRQEQQWQSSYNLDKQRFDMAKTEWDANAPIREAAITEAKAKGLVFGDPEYVKLEKQRNQLAVKQAQLAVLNGDQALLADAGDTLRGAWTQDIAIQKFGGDSKKVQEALANGAIKYPSLQELMKQYGGEINQSVQEYLGNNEGIGYNWMSGIFGIDPASGVRNFGNTGIQQRHMWNSPTMGSGFATNGPRSIMFNGTGSSRTWGR